MHRCCTAQTGGGRNAAAPHGIVRTRVVPAEIAQGATVLVAQLLGLLTALVGEALTMRIVRQAWPELRFTDGDSVDGSQT